MNRKQILVTGASRGIGKACAIHFAKEGWHVFLNCRKSISELQATADFITKETSGSCEILPGDVGVPSEVGRSLTRLKCPAPVLTYSSTMPESHGWDF